MQLEFDLSEWYKAVKSPDLVILYSRCCNDDMSLIEDIELDRRGVLHEKVKSSWATSALGVAVSDSSIGNVSS
jgi:hypothetical protein